MLKKEVSSKKRTESKSREVFELNITEFLTGIVVERGGFRTESLGFQKRTLEVVALGKG